MIEKGEFEARPLKYAFGKSKTKQTEMVSVTFQFMEGPNQGKQMTYDGYFTDATAKRTLDSLEYCGWDGRSSLSELKGFGSKNVLLVVEDEEGQDGELRPRIKWVNRLFGRGPATVYEKSEVQSLSERLAAVNAERIRENEEKAGTKREEPNPFGN